MPTCPSDSQPVQCTACGWRGLRVYALVDRWPAGAVKQDRGFGLCRKCGGDMVRRSVRRTVTTTR